VKKAIHTDDVVGGLQSFFEQQPHVICAWLFGSRGEARGDPTAISMLRCCWTMDSYLSKS
jgi:hypothetical protein